MIRPAYDKAGNRIGLTVTHGWRLTVIRHPCIRKAYGLATVLLQVWKRLPELPPKSVYQSPLKYGNGQQ